MHSLKLRRMGVSGYTTAVIQQQYSKLQDQDIFRKLRNESYEIVYKRV